MPPPVQSDAQKAYEAYLSGTEPVTDSMRRAARAYLLLAVALGKVMSSQTLRVKDVADAMTRDHDYMSKLNEVIQLAGATASGNGEHYAVFSAATQEEVLEFRAAFLTAARMGTGNPNDYTFYQVKNGPPVEYLWKLMVDECSVALKNLQADVDDLNSLSQQEQLALQTLMTNLNNAIEASTAGTQKAGTQAQAVLRELGG